MRTRWGLVQTKSFFLISLLLIVDFAIAGDLGFRYHRGTLRCQDSKGQQGFNPLYIGECGDHGLRNYEGRILNGKNLRGSNFSKANLSHAKLRRTLFYGARFFDARLMGADFSYAKAGRADFRDAHLNQAILYWTNLQSSHLEGADLTQADLRGATLDLAWYDQTTRWSGAIFDEYTSLPFSEKDAFAFGMKFQSSDQQE